MRVVTGALASGMGDRVAVLVASSKEVMIPCWPSEGRRGRMSASRLRRPSSTSWRMETEVMSLVMEAIVQIVEGVKGVGWEGLREERPVEWV